MDERTMPMTLENLAFAVGEDEEETDKPKMLLFSTQRPARFELLEQYFYVEIIKKLDMRFFRGECC